MAVRLRLRRMGTKNKVCYRIVAADSRSPRDGRFIEILGYYDPRHASEKINLERVEYWVSNGAQPSKTVAAVIKRAENGPTEEVASEFSTETVEKKADDNSDVDSGGGESITEDQAEKGLQIDANAIPDSTDEPNVENNLETGSEAVTKPEESNKNSDDTPLPDTTDVKKESKARKTSERKPKDSLEVAKTQDENTDDNSPDGTSSEKKPKDSLEVAKTQDENTDNNSPDGTSSEKKPKDSLEVAKTQDENTDNNSPDETSSEKKPKDSLEVAKTQDENTDNNSPDGTSSEKP